MPSVRNTSVPPRELSIRVVELESGLTVVGEPNPDARSVSVGYFIDTGARDENLDAPAGRGGAGSESGVSHFLEHMTFKGTRSRSSSDLTMQMGDIGAQANAYTSEESTVYYASVLPEHFRQMHELLADMMIPALDPDEFEMERKVILEEIALYEDRPHFYLFEHALQEYFGAHPAGNSVLGTVASVGALTREQMRQYHRRRYTTANMVVAAAGRFEWEPFVEEVRRLSADVPRGGEARIVTPYAAPPLQREYRKREAIQAHALFLMPSCSVESEDRFALEILSMIVGDGSGSKMYWELVDPGLVESAGTDLEERHGTGVFMAYAGCEPARIDEVESRMEGILHRAAEFSDGELERAKTKLSSKIVMSGELPMGRFMALGTEYLARGQVHSLHYYVERVRGVSRADIIDALDRHPIAGWSKFRLLPEGA